MSTAATIVLSIGVVLWLVLLYFIFTPWAMWRRPKPRHVSSPLIFLFGEERARRRRRAMKRAGHIETPTGKKRIGL